MKFIVDFDDNKDMAVTTELMCFVEKLGVCSFKQLYNLEHWFSDIMVIEYEDKNSDGKEKNENEDS